MKKLLLIILFSFPISSYCATTMNREIEGVSIASTNINIGISTGTLRSEMDSVWVSTGTLQQQIIDVGSDILNSTNTWVGGNTFPIMTMSGSVVNKYKVVTTTYTVLPNDYFLNVVTDVSCTVNLPTAVGITGKLYDIKKSTGTAIVTVLPNGSETVAGYANYILSAQRSSIKVMSTGTGWALIGGMSLPVVPHIICFSTATLTVANSTTTYPVTYTQNTDAEAMRHTANDSKIYFDDVGDFLVTVSAIVDTTTNTAMKFDMWLKKDGVNVPLTNTQVGFDSGAVQQTLAFSYVVDIDTIGRYIELWYHGSNTNGRLLYVAGSTNPDIPECPSIIVTVNKIGR